MKKVSTLDIIASPGKRSAQLAPRKRTPCNLATSCTEATAVTGSEMPLSKCFLSIASLIPCGLVKTFHAEALDALLGKGDFPDTRYQLSNKATEALGRMMSFMLRGWANDRGVTDLDFDPNDVSVNFSEFYDAFSERRNGLTLWKIIDVTTRNSKGWYEIFGSAKDDATRRGQASNWNLLKIRAIQGHNSKVINEDADPLKISIRQYALGQGWTLSFRDLPKLGPMPCMTEVFASMPNLGYHASY